MCLPKFIEFKNIPEQDAVTGYRAWKNKIQDSNILISEYANYTWKEIEGPHEVLEENSGIYSYNNYNNSNYNYYNNNNYNYNNYNNNNNNYNYYNYYLIGIIKQWGKTAIHEEGYRSEFAKIDTLFNIRESDAEGPQKFLDWIKFFNGRISDISQKYNCKVISWQDFLES
jgi:hypothetical protein